MAISSLSLASDAGWLPTEADSLRRPAAVFVGARVCDSMMARANNETGIDRFFFTAFSSSELIQIIHALKGDGR
jgi:hypothetical protein